MCKRIIIGCLVGCFSFHVQAQSSLVVIDGKIGDWPDFNAVQKIENTCCKVLADTSFLYVGFVTSDRSVIKDVLLNGMDLQFFEKRCLRKKQVTYPLGISRVIKEPKLKNRNREFYLHDVILNLRFSLGVKGIVRRRPFVSDTRNVKIGIEAKYNLLDHNLMIIETKIPLRYLVKDTKKWKKIRIRFAIQEGTGGKIFHKKMANIWQHFEIRTAGRCSKRRRFTTQLENN